MRHVGVEALACVGVFAAGGCSQSATTGDEGQTPPSTPPAAVTTPVCAPGSSEPLLAFHGGGCPWELVSASDGVRLRSLAPEPPPAIAGVLPEDCATRRCAFSGLESSVGPLVLAVLPSPQSEMPAGTWLGAVIDGRLRFVDLWEGAGASVVGDGTPLGPAHVLGPHDCGGALALFPVERLDGAQGFAPPATLVARGGRLLADGDADVKTEAIAAAGCAPLDGLSLP